MQPSVYSLLHPAFLDLPHIWKGKKKDSHKAVSNTAGGQVALERYQCPL